jgi:hypothetical protein
MALAHHRLRNRLALVLVLRLDSWLLLLLFVRVCFPCADSQIVAIVVRQRLKNEPKAIFEYLPPPPDEWEVARNRILIKEEIGSGEFGTVNKAQIISGEVSGPTQTHA